MHQIDFGAGGTYSAPIPHSLIWGVASRQGGGLGWEEEGKGSGKEGGRSGGEGKGEAQVTVEPGPLRALLRHCLSG